MSKKLPVKVILNRTVVRDDHGRILQGVARPFQFEIRIGRMVLTGCWLCNTDEKSQEYFDMVVDALMSGDVEAEVKDGKTHG